MKTIFFKKYKDEDTMIALSRGMKISIEESKNIIKNERQRCINIAFLITEYEEINNTGDKYSAISLAEQLKKIDDNINIYYYVKEPRLEWGNISEIIDYIICMDPSVDINYLKKLRAKKICWVRGNQERWIKEGKIYKYDQVVVSSKILYNRLESLGIIDKVAGIATLGIPIDIQNNIKNIDIQWKDRKNDLVFIGNIYDIERPIVKNLELNSKYDFKFYGNINELNHKWDSYNYGNVNHSNIHHIYLSTKIVIEDIAPFNKGTVNLRTFEASACGALVISNYDEAIEELFGDAVEMYKTKDELNQKIKYYLEHDYERINKAKQLYKLVWSKYTFENSAKNIYNNILKLDI